jgi:hypothetical protein
MDRKDYHYIGKDKPRGWYEKEQEKYLRLWLGNEIFEWLEEIERERRERNDT